ncbi:MAG: hypothetical protein KGI97_06165 [Alphaproteobacteria bacterium]|nr:hypothetical protein [Alphaproteobacteria bacterium]
MTSGIGNIGSVQGAVSVPAVSAPAATVNAAKSSTSAGAYAPASSGLSAPFPNVRTISDPLAGQITEYLSANGSQLLEQIPSAVTVAYLQQGLTADGLPKQQQPSSGIIA